MSIYNPAIPQAGDYLSDSQGQILQNFDKANTSFGIDHYNFANATANNGKHNQVTTPIFVDSPPSGFPPITIADEPKVYAFKETQPVSLTPKVGAINYTRGPLNAVPTPLTSLHSPVTPLVVLAGNTTDVLDFTGLARAFCLITASDMTGVPGTLNTALALVVWTGTNLSFFNIVGTNTGSVRFQISGDILQILIVTTPANNLYWTLDFLRIS